MKVTLTTKTRNESFEQCEEKVENEYSVNIPMRYYYKSAFTVNGDNVVFPPAQDMGEITIPIGNVDKGDYTRCV